jgi:hypothetical protein
MLCRRGGRGDCEKPEISLEYIYIYLSMETDDVLLNTRQQWRHNHHSKYI